MDAMEDSLWDDNLPNIAALQILSYLDVSDVLPFSQVCTRWNSWLYGISSPVDPKEALNLLTLFLENR